MALLWSLAKNANTKHEEILSGTLASAFAAPLMRFNWFDFFRLRSKAQHGHRRVRRQRGLRRDIQKAIRFSQRAEPMRALRAGGTDFSGGVNGNVHKMTAAIGI